MSIRTSTFSRAAVVGFLLLASVASAHAAATSIVAGTDCWQTDPTDTVARMEFPAGFFTRGGQTSLAFGPVQVPVQGVPLPAGTCTCQNQNQTVEMQWVDVHGTPVPDDSEHKVSQVVSTYDTCVRRNTDTVLTASGVGVTVPIELLELHLVSVAPISVPMSAGGPCTYTVNILEEGTQVAGSLKFTPDGKPLNKGDLEMISLPVGYELQFTEENGCDAEPNSTVLSVTFQNTNGTFKFGRSDAGPSMNAWAATAVVALLLLGLSFMIWRRQSFGNTAS